MTRDLKVPRLLVANLSISINMSNILMWKNSYIMTCNASHWVVDKMSSLFNM